MVVARSISRPLVAMDLRLREIVAGDLDRRYLDWIAVMRLVGWRSRWRACGITRSKSCVHCTITIARADTAIHFLSDAFAFASALSSFISAWIR